MLAVATPTASTTPTLSFDSDNKRSAAMDDKCLEAFVQQHGWELGKPIAHGTTGTVYALEESSPVQESKTAGKRVLKVNDRNNEQQEHESKYATAAGELGIGPKVFESGTCGDNSLVVLQRLSGPTLLETYPFEPERIQQALLLYHRLLTQTGIAQHDLTADNLIFDQDRLYLIDYGRSIKLNRLDHAEAEKEMRHMANALVLDIEDAVWESDPDYKTFTNAYRSAASDWLAATYDSGDA